MRPGEGLRSLSPFKFLSRCGELSARFLYRPQTGRQTRSVKIMWRRWCTGGAAGGCGFGSIHFHVQRGGPYYLVLPFREVIMHEAITKKRLPPSAARKAECRNCLNTDRLMNPCESRVCELNKTGKSILKRIKAHCISCVPEQTIYGVKACTGQNTPYMPSLVFSTWTQSSFARTER